MPATLSTRKDVAEFFRLGLLAGVCQPAAVALWAEAIVTAEASPHFSFIELSVSASRPASALQTLLADVPGQPTPGLPFKMLLGHCSRLLALGGVTAEPLVLDLYEAARLEAPDEDITHELSGFEDEFCLARDGVYGSMGDFARHFADFLAGFEPYAPPIQPQTPNPALERTPTGGELGPESHVRPRQ